MNSPVAVLYLCHHSINLVIIMQTWGPMLDNVDDMMQLWVWYLVAHSYV